MLKGRGGPFQFGGGILVQQRSLRTFLLSSSMSISPAKCRGFQPLLNTGDPTCERRNVHSLPKYGSRLSLWSFGAKCHGVSLSLNRPKGLHTSSRGKVTTSELIRRAQLDSSKSLSPNDNVYVEVSMEAMPALEESAPPRTGEESTEKENSLAKLIPRHVVARGLSKKETFFAMPEWKAKRDGVEIPQVSRRKESSIPVLGLSKKHEASNNDSVGLQARTHQKKSGKVPTITHMPRTWSDEGFGRPDGLLAAGFKKITSNNETEEDRPPGQFKPRVASHWQSPQHSESLRVGGRQIYHDYRGSNAQSQEYRESPVSTIENSKVTGFHLHQARKKSEKYGEIDSEPSPSTGRIPWRSSDNLPYEFKQSLDRRPTGGMKVQGHRTNMESTDSQRFTRRATIGQLSMEGHYTSTKPFERIRPKRKVKNDLLEKDISLQSMPDEPHYEFIIRRKEVRTEAEKALKFDPDDPLHVGDDWVRKRIGWLCKELPVLKPSGILKMLNKQKTWIKQEHLVEIIEHLVKQEELNRAHKALKWMQQQKFYQFEYELHNNMAYILGRNNKLSRCQDVFDEMVRNGRFPDTSVFTALIKAYLTKGDKDDIDDAWKLYNQMLQLELTISASLSETLLRSLTCPTCQWISQAEELLGKMKASGLYINEEMYCRVIVLYGKRGDHKKVDEIITEMENEDLEIDVDIFNARLAACAKDGDLKKAELTFRNMIERGMNPNWHSHAYLIQIYGKANLPEQSWEVFESMKGKSIHVNFTTYHAIVEAMAADGMHIDKVLQVLTEVEETGVKPLQPFYNSVMSMYLKLKMYEDVESIFNRGMAHKARPTHAAYNLLIKSYMDSGQHEKAEAVFQGMKKTVGMGPNTHTYNLMLEGYGVACFKGKVREIFEEMLDKGCQIDPDVKDHIQSMIGVKRVAQLDLNKLKLTDEQREVIPGLLLGGAKMESPDKECTYELHLEFNCENQVRKVLKNHLAFMFQAWWKQGIRPARLSDEETPNEGSDTKSFIRLQTVSHGSLRFYANQYRPKGEPVIPKLIHRWLKPRTLAYWYMYGGRKCQRTGGIVLNARNYSGKQIQLVVKALKARTMDCRRKKMRYGDVIRFEGKSAKWLWKLMEPHILEVVREQLKPEEIPVDLTFARSTSHTEFNGGVSSDEDDWEDLEDEKDEMACTCT